MSAGEQLYGLNHRKFSVADGPSSVPAPAASPGQVLHFAVENRCLKVFLSS